jgi:hypothetical protein
MDWTECIKIKAKSHIFIDQVLKDNPKVYFKRWGNNGIKYPGALGKSGLEAMLTKCFTITGCEKLKTEPYFPEPPVLYTDYYSLYEDLELAIKNQPFRNEVIRNQFTWASIYLSPLFVKSNITRHIDEAI